MKKNIIASILGLLAITVASQNVSIDTSSLDEGHSVLKSQQIFNEGYIVLEKYKSSTEETTNSTGITYIKNHIIRAESTSVTFNGAGEVYTTTIYDGKTKELLVLTDHPLHGKKDTLDKKMGSEWEIANFEVIKGDKEKNILGYECQQFIIKRNGNSKDALFEIYVTDELNSEVSNAPDFVKNKIKGYVLSLKTNYERDGEPIEQFWEVVKIVNKKLPDDMFSLIPPKEYTKSDHYIRD